MELFLVVSFDSHEIEACHANATQQIAHEISEQLEIAFGSWAKSFNSLKSCFEKISLEVGVGVGDKDEKFAWIKFNLSIIFYVSFSVCYLSLVEIKFLFDLEVHYFYSKVFLFVFNSK